MHSLVDQLTVATTPLTIVPGRFPEIARDCPDDLTEL